MVEEKYRFYQEIVEIHRVIFLQSFVIDGVDLRCHLFHSAFGQLIELRRQDEIIF